MIRRYRYMKHRSYPVIYLSITVLIFIRNMGNDIGTRSVCVATSTGAAAGSVH